MKCHKCAFISFDYLSECRKCSVDLTGTREKLGFSSLKPSEPFFLGSLLRDYRSEARTMPVMAMGAEGAESELAEIDLGPEVSLDLDFDDLEEVGSSTGTFQGQPEMREQLDSARKVLEDIEGAPTTRAQKPSGHELELDLDSVLDAATTPGAGKRPATSPEMHVELPDDMEIEISTADLEELVGESATRSGAGSPEKPVTASTETADLEDIDSLLMGDEDLPKTEDDMVVELSSDDLDGLLLELDDPSGDKGKKTK